MGANTHQQIFPILNELRFVMLAGVITGFGRAIGEVGAAMMLGGNIQGVTRTMRGEVYGTSKFHHEISRLISRATKLTAHGGNRNSKSYKNQAG